MRKIVLLLCSVLLTMTSVSAETISKTLNGLGVNKSAVSVLVKDVNSANVVYSLNSETPRLPASTLKLITTAAAVDTLGSDFKYSTSLYKSTNNDLYFLLTGDPLLQGYQLTQIVKTAKAKNIVPKNIYIDDSAFDNNEWGEGWQWDDELNPLMPKFSVYNINGNLLKLELAPTLNLASANLTLKPFYPLTFMNLVTTNLNAPSMVVLEKNTDIASNILNVSGSVGKLKVLNVPVPNPKMNFVLRLQDSIKSAKLEYYSPIKYSKIPTNNIYLVDNIEHEISELLPLVYKNSNNFVAETLFKSAGAKWANSQGSNANSMAMLNEYLRKLNLDATDVKIVDGSGVSKNNLMTATFMVDFLLAKAHEDNFDEYKLNLPTPSEGTLKNRMLYFKDNLYAKTGTLSDTSAIAGYIVSKSGKLYAFDIMINDAKTSSTEKKNIENQILRNIYINY